MRATPTGEVKVVEDVAEIRKLLHSWQEIIIRPEYVFMAPVEEGRYWNVEQLGEFSLFKRRVWFGLIETRSAFYTAVDYPDHYGPRSK